VKRTGLVRNLLLSAVSVALALGIGEMLARVLRPIPYTTAGVWPGFDRQLRRRHFVPDPVAGYVPGPAWAPDGRRGFMNGSEYDGHAEPATEIAVLGDSLVQDRALGRALQARLAGTAARVWYAGIGGYNTLQEAYYLEHFVGLDPNVIVLEFCLNDFNRSMVVVGGADDGKLVAPDFEPIGAVNPWLFDHSALYRLGQSALIARRTGGQYSPEGVRANRDNVRRGLARIQRQAQAKGAALRVILYPHLEEPQPWEREARVQALAIFAELGIASTDVTDEFARRGWMALRRTPEDPVHPSAEGHAIAAERLLEAFPDVFPLGPAAGR
jgi:lysophospholipase L1-like esterase